MLIRKIWEEGQGALPRERLLVDEHEAETVALGYVSIQPGESTQEGFHEDEEEIYVVLEGRARLRLGEETAQVEKGHVVYVPRRTVHQMTCISAEPLQYLYFANWPGRAQPQSGDA